jgi:LemA protein
VTPFIVAGAIALVAIGVLLAIYNRFVHLRNVVQESWRNVDTELQRRHDLVPNLVDTVKGYAAHEREVMDSVTSLRVSAMAMARAPGAQAAVESDLGRELGRLVALAERYPDLRASEQFLALQRELVETEDRIQVARRIYNANVRRYDTLVQTFPSMLVARLFEFRPEEFFELEPAVRAAGPPAVDLGQP